MNVAAAPSSCSTPNHATTTFLPSVMDDADLVVAENDDVYEDVTWSIYSNTFFVGGGLCYVVGTCWDWKLVIDYDDPMDYLSHTKTLNLLYRGIWLMGPFVYLLNSFIDVAWAMKTKSREEKRRGLEKFYRESFQTAADASTEDDVGGGQDVQRALKKFEEHAKVDDALVQGAIQSAKDGEAKRLGRLGKIVTPKRILRGIRRHIGHRRDLMAAATFGIAAALGLFGMIFENQPLDALSIHMYLLSAMFALCGRQQPPSSSTTTTTTTTNYPITPPRSLTLLGFLVNAEALENLGDAFFAFASIIDVILCDFSFDDDIYWWPIVSSILWLLDALLYLRSDFVTLYDTSRREETRMVQGILDGCFDSQGDATSLSPLHKQVGQRTVLDDYALIQEETPEERGSSKDRQVWLEIV